MQTVIFTYAGLPGFASRTKKDTMVSWNGQSFYLEAASPSLRAVVEAVFKRVHP